MTILGALQSAAIRLNGTRPDVFFTSAELFEREICDLANEVAADVMKSHDWQALIKIASLDIIDGQASYGLPADYDRMLIDSEVQDPISAWFGYGRMQDINEYVRASAGNGGMVGTLGGGWILIGNELHFTPAPQGGPLKFPYISTNFALGTQDGVARDRFTRDDDNFLLPDRLLTLGLVWRWREQKKLDFTGDQEAFVKAINEYAGKDGGARLIRVGMGPALRDGYRNFAGFGGRY